MEFNKKKTSKKCLLQNRGNSMDSGKEIQKSNTLFASLLGFFASVKLTITVLLLLAATSVIGTLIPQNAEPVVYVRTYGEFACRMLYVFDLFDMYHSWWFRTIIGLLTANIAVCTNELPRRKQRGINRKPS